MTSPGIAETLTIELPDLVGDLEPPPSGSSAAFDFGTYFIDVEQVRIDLRGTFTPGSAHGDGVQFPVDEWFEVPAEIEVTMEPGVGSCFTFLNPLESPFNMQQAFELHHGASWDFLLDGTDEVTAYSNTPIMGGKVVVTPPTVEISEAYLVLEGVVPEPATLVLLAMGALCLQAKYGKRLSS
jgi:hypothetical protein